MVKWEYKDCELTDNNDLFAHDEYGQLVTDKDGCPVEVQYLRMEELNAYGKDGWEFIEFRGEGAFMKRKIKKENIKKKRKKVRSSA